MRAENDRGKKKTQTEGKAEEEMRPSARQLHKERPWQREGEKDGVMNERVCLRTDRPALACMANAGATG